MILYQQYPSNDGNQRRFVCGFDSPQKTGVSLSPVLSNVKITLLSTMIFAHQRSIGRTALNLEVPNYGPFSVSSMGIFAKSRHVTGNRQP